MLMCDACESMNNITGRSLGIESIKNLNHSKNKSLLIHPFGDNFTIQFGKQSALRLSFHLTPLNIIKGGIHDPLAHTHPKSVCVSPRSA